MIKGDDSIYPNPADAYSKGLTLRQFFAAQLMVMEVPGSEISFEQRRDVNLNPHNTPDKPTPRTVDQILAERAVKRADALIEALNK